MVTPKDTNDHFPRKTRNSPEKEFIHPNSCMPCGFDQIMTILPQNSPDKNLFSHITAKSVDLTQIA